MITYAQIWDTVGGMFLSGLQFTIILVVAVKTVWTMDPVELGLVFEVLEAQCLLNILKIMDIDYC